MSSGNAKKDWCVGSVAIILFMWLCKVSESCSCVRSHPQEHFCHSQIVALVYVKHAGKMDWNLKSYDVSVKKIFKGDLSRNQTYLQLWTPLSESMCGIQLHNRTRYLVTAVKLDDRVHVTGCNFVQEWKTLTRKQRKGFQRLFMQGCSCSVRPDYGGRNRISHGGRHDTCVWKTAWETEWDCQGKYSLCVPQKTIEPGPKSCQWLPSHAYRRCMKEWHHAKRKFREP